MTTAASPRPTGSITIAWVAASLALAFCSGIGFAADPDAIAMLTRAAEHGADASQVLLAVAYLNGDAGLTRDPGRAAYWFEQAAIRGNAYAEERLGDLYEQGIGIAENRKLAFDWRVKAARRGSLEAQVKVGRMLQDGIGVGRDIDQAIYWFHRAAAEGNAEAQSLLDHLDHYGSDKELDQAVGRSWFEAAAKRGYEAARHFVDLLEDAGYWIAENWHHRVPGLEKVARDGDLEAAYQLARRYESGTGGVRQNDAVALEWYRRAAEGNHREAMRALARIYADGRDGAPRDSIESARWAARAEQAAGGAR